MISIFFDLFKYSHGHVCQAVAWQVKVFHCGPTFNLVVNIARMLRKPMLK